MAAPVLAQRMELHIARKLWHASTGLAMALVYGHLLTRPWATAVLGCMLALALSLEWGRLKSPRINRLAINLWAPLMRREEKRRMTGVPFYIGAALLCVAVFPKPVAILSLLYLAIGDPMASVFGILYGNRGPRLAGGKSVAGSVAAFFACAVVTLLVLDPLPFTEWQLIGLALWGGVLGGGAELLPLEVDDNFAIPLVSGFGQWMAFLLLGAA